MLAALPPEVALTVAAVQVTGGEIDDIGEMTRPGAGDARGDRTLSPPLVKRSPAGTRLFQQLLMALRATTAACKYVPQCPSDTGS